jgi:hypothetical protein
MLQVSDKYKRESLLLLTNSRRGRTLCRQSLYVYPDINSRVPVNLRAGICIRVE